MPEVIKIFLVEDDISQIELYDDAKEEHNENTTNTKIEYCKPGDYKEMLHLFETQSFDAAIIDLNLSQWGTGMEDKGKEIITKIRQHARYPVFIISGSIDEAVTQLASENKFIDAYNRDEKDTNALLLEIQTLHKTGITKVLGSRGLIEKHLNDIFWNHFAQSKDYWLKHPLIDNPNLENVVSRYTLTHLYEYVNSYNQYDITEMYIKPVIKSELSPGSIIEYKGFLYLIMSPACDLSQKKCDFITLIKLDPFFKNSSLKEKKTAYQNALRKREKSTGDETIKTELEASIAKKLDALKQTIQTFAKNNKGDRYYFLPKFLDFDAHLVDFQNIKTVNPAEVSSKNISMSVTVHFLKDIQAKFSSYYARQGSPDFDFKEIAELYTKEYLDI